MDKMEIKASMIAGYLHDIGKLAIPSEVLYKNDKLTYDEMQTIRKHPYFTYTILNSFQIFETIKDWASFHHEFLDGSGYPFHIAGKKLCTGCRIMTISDIFTAMTEERPYRKCEPKDNLINILKDMVRANKIDERYVNILVENYDQVFESRAKFQQEAMAEFNLFRKNIFSNQACEKNNNFINVLKA